MPEKQDLPSAQPDMERQFAVELRGHLLQFTTTWGLFHPKGVDVGTGLLLEHIEIAEDATCLDLGCGWGPIGLTLARLAPRGHVHLIDKDFVAVEYARRNADANGLPQARAYLSNSFSHVPEETRFDVIVSNLPAKSGSELLGHWVNESQQRLRREGVLWVVTVSGLKDYVKRVFRQTFGNYHKVKQSGTHVVACAIRS
ncbi:MAG: methyltransferase [Candidatus Latescibacterota bacterium]|nr:methyltransferase [Candidatus Latescibacterota bacterium]